MLHRDPFLIAPETFKLIIDLQNLMELKEFNLVGGTALALQIGHRNSIDIDLFCQGEFNNQQLLELLNNSNFQIDVKLNVKNSIIGFINGIKVDFIRHNFPIIRPVVLEEGIRMLSIEDIAAMKLHAITNSGKRLKDFIDIYFLLEQYCLDDLIDFYTAKYPNYNPMIALRAVSYFGDIDLEIDPPKLLKPLSFEEVTSRIREAVLNSQKTFRG